MISYGKQSIDESDIEAVIEILRGDWLTQGPHVESFERDLSSYFGSEYCSVTSSGTAALHLTGLALGWKPGDIILTTPITFLASANCILYVGATPDFVDIDPQSYTLDHHLLEEKILHYRRKGKKVKAVIAVDYAGNPCDWKSLKSIADKYGVQLVNDNCHALGASYDGSTKYAADYADVAIQSFHPVKHITTGEGGAVLTNNQNIDKKIKLLRSHGISKEQNILEKNDGPWYYEMHALGFNYRITDIQCALGISQLAKLDSFISKRKEIAKIYDIAFNDDDRYVIPSVNSNVIHAYHLYPLQINFDILNISKAELFIGLNKLDIQLQVHYIPIHTQPYYINNYGFKWGDYPIAESYYKNVVSLPIYPDLTNKDVSYVIEKIKSFK
jgi:UDP-4-amino-4,6-dideoxy-N-acetyl-beta-L-altrosamine transaminase